MKPFTTLRARAVAMPQANIDTDQVIAFTRALVKATAQGQKADASVPVEVVINTSAGHRSTLHDHELLAAWLLQQFGLAQ